MSYKGRIGLIGGWCALFLISGSIGGCTTVLAPTHQGAANESSQRCAPAMAKRAKTALAAGSQASVTPSIATLSRFSADALEVAEVAGVVPLLNHVAETSRQDPLASMRFRQRLTELLLLTLFEITSTTAELTCERDRADQVADRIDEIDGARVKRLTIASILFGGIAGIVSGGIGLAAGASVGGEAADVAGGVLASWFGVSALFTHSDVDFRHDRNVLQEIWDDPPEPRLFSPTIWRYLHRAHDGKKVPREQVLDSWHQAGRLGENGSPDEQERRRLFFGTGGRYGAAELHARASMLETLEASIRLLYEQLEVLMREIAEETADIS
ncbi:MAG: hypothetical protein LZF60_80085 [Nitrospira sp.]|nr:MAG: hypothetical protein LZF60_80085 [Nitrospira sp.]